MMNTLNIQNRHIPPDSSWALSSCTYTLLSPPPVASVCRARTVSLFFSLLFSCLDWFYVSSSHYCICKSSFTWRLHWHFFFSFAIKANNGSSACVVFRADTVERWPDITFLLSQPPLLLQLSSLFNILMCQSVPTGRSEQLVGFW